MICPFVFWFYGSIVLKPKSCNSDDWCRSWCPAQAAKTTLWGARSLRLICLGGKRWQGDGTLVTIVIHQQNLYEKRIIFEQNDVFLPISLWKFPESQRTHFTHNTGWWFQPLWKIWKSAGITIPYIYIWKNKLHVPNHQPEYVIIHT